MIIKALAVVVLAVSVCAAEAPDFSMPTFAHFAASHPAPVPPASRVPARLPDGTVSGTIDGVAVDLTFSRRAGKISGALEQRGVSLDYTGDGNAAAGSAFGEGADYSVATNEDGSFTFTGHVRGREFSYAYSDVDHTVTGSIGGREVKIDFDPAEGTASGTAGGQEFKLSLDSVSGKMTGTIEGRSVALTLVNEGLGNFLENLFFFVP